MRNITKIFTLVLSLILLFAVSCSNDDKTGVANNPPENDTEITDGETGSGGTETGGSGTETGGSGTETGGGSGTGTGGSGEGGSGSGSGSEEGGGGTETPPTEPETPPSPSEPEVTEIDAKDFPTDLQGSYAHSKTGYHDTRVYSMINEGVKTTVIQATFDNGTVDGARHNILIEKWKKTTKGGKIIKLEGERDKGHGCYTVTFDCETKTISGTFKFPEAGADWSFSGTKR